MSPILNISGLSNDVTACDSLLVELHDSNNPDAIVASATTLLHTDGHATVLFPATVNNHTCYIVVRQQNSMVTWSKDPVFIHTQVFSFDFTSP